MSLKSSNGIIHRVEDSQNLNSYCEFKNHFLQSATFGKLWTLKSFGSQIFLKLLSLVDSFKTIGFLKCFICLIKDLSLNYLSTSDYQNKAKQNNKQTKKPTAFALKKKKKLLKIVSSDSKVPYYDFSWSWIPEFVCYFTDLKLKSEFILESRE